MTIIVMISLERSIHEQPTFLYRYHITKHFCSGYTPKKLFRHEFPVYIQTWVGDPLRHFSNFVMSLIWIGILTMNLLKSVHISVVESNELIQKDRMVFDGSNSDWRMWNTVCNLYNISILWVIKSGESMNEPQWKY